MRLHKLRIAWSVACGVVAASLICLWVRSYWWLDGAIGSISPTKTLVLGSGSGRFSARVDDSRQPHRYSGPWRYDHTDLAKVDDLLNGLGQTVSHRFPIFGFSGEDFFLSHWFLIVPVVLLGSISSRPCLAFQFSLRTVLIATTLIAIVLGLIAWSMR